MIKIAVTGPEGSGKSILASAVAKYFNCTMIKDYCAHYLERKEGDVITEQDLIKIASGKLEWEAKIIQDNQKMFISDGELLMLKIWAEYKFHKCPQELKALVNKQYYDLYILTFPDNKKLYPFMREDPTLGNYFYNAYKKEFEENQLPFITVDGDFYQRQKASVKVIEKLIKDSRTS